MSKSLLYSFAIFVCSALLSACGASVQPSEAPFDPMPQVCPAAQVNCAGIDQAVLDHITNRHCIPACIPHNPPVMGVAQFSQDVCDNNLDTLAHARTFCTAIRDSAACGIAQPNRAVGSAGLAIGQSSNTGVCQNTDDVAIGLNGAAVTTMFPID